VTFAALEDTLLSGQKLQGVLTSNEVQEILEIRRWEKVRARTVAGCTQGMRLQAGHTALACSERRTGACAAPRGACRHVAQKQKRISPIQMHSFARLMFKVHAHGSLRLFARAGLAVHPALGIAGTHVGNHPPAHTHTHTEVDPPSPPPPHTHTGVPAYHWQRALL
jgi:hypothetical protein